MFKFRAYDKRKKIMIHDFDQAFGEIYALPPGARIHTTIYAIGMFYNTLMLCTGRKDKNGKEIYQGDFILNTHPMYKDFEQCNKPFIIDWANDDEYCGFVARRKGQEIGELFLNRDFENCEIIGNKWENPELWEEKIG